MSDRKLRARRIAKTYNAQWRHAVAEWKRAVTARGDRESARYGTTTGQRQ